MVCVLSDHERNGAAPGERERPALTLVNSRRKGRSGPIDELTSPAELCRWLENHQVVSVPRCDSAALRSVIVLRDAVRDLLLARIEGRTPNPRSLHEVNEAAALAPSAPHLAWPSADGPSARCEHVGAGGIALARALLAADAIDLVTGPDHAHLRACNAPGCQRLLLKDHPRRQWCSTRCGDRVRASRYYQRHRSGREV